MPQSMPQHEFDAKFETLLVFLVEAIGVPVLLSLLLLAYSSVRTQGGSNPGLALCALTCPVFERLLGQAAAKGAQAELAAAEAEMEAQRQMAATVAALQAETDRWEGRHAALAEEHAAMQMAYARARASTPD